MLELLKVIVQPVVLERDEHGKIVREQAQEPIPCYSLDQVKEVLAIVDTRIKQMNEQTPMNGNGGGPMPVDQATVVKIECDNPNCPGNDLDQNDRTGWLFISSEVYGDPTQSHVFCSASCVSAATADVETAKALGFTHDPDAVPAGPTIQP